MRACDICGHVTYAGDVTYAGNVMPSSNWSQRESPVEKSSNSNEKARKIKNTNKRSITDLNAPNGSRDIPFQG